MYALFKDDLQISLIEISVEEIEPLIQKSKEDHIVGIPFCYAFKDKEMLLWPLPDKSYTIEEVKEII